METITIQLNKIKSNPFKKFIKDGELNEEIVSKLMEGYKQTKFHVNFKARYDNNNNVELIYGHHRLEAAKKSFGEDHEIKLDVYSNEEFNDEKMLLDMVRENLTQRGDDYKDLSDCVLLVKKWLENNRTAKGLYNSKQTHKNKISTREISQFLSNEGKLLSHTSVSKVIHIEESLDKSIKEKVSDKLGRGSVENGKIGTELAYKLSSFDKKEQKALLKLTEKTKDLSEEKKIKLLTEYRKSPETIKQDVKKGKIKIEDVSIENFKEKIKEKAKNSKGKEEVKVKELEKFMREGENLIGTTNATIFKTCVFFESLTKTGLIHKLDWNTIHEMLENAQKGGEQYSKFVKKIIKKI